MKTPRVPIRWIVFGVWIFSSALNYLDRQVLAALAPLLKAEFHLSNTDYGLILSAFSITYAACAPLAGLLIDRIGLNRGIGLSVGCWSLASLATALAGGLPGFVACRAALGLSESAGVPATGKAIHTYLRPEERAVGNAWSQTGISLGSMLAPPLAIGMALHFGWRWAFAAVGLAGLLWIPLWFGVAGRAPRMGSGKSAGAARIALDRAMWGLILANVLSMTVYTLWFNWTTIFLVQKHGLPLARTAWLAAAPPLFASLGGLTGGWLSMRWMRRGAAAPQARLRVCRLSALLLLATAGVPWIPDARLATAAICLSFFWVTAMSVNVYTIPLDLYGGARAAFAVSLLTSSYGAMQTLLSPGIGALVDSAGFEAVCGLVAVLPLAGYGILRVLGRESL